MVERDLANPFLLNQINKLTGHGVAAKVFWSQTIRTEFPMVTRIWHGATAASKSDEHLNLMRTVAIPDYRSTPGNNGAYALRRIQ